MRHSAGVNAASSAAAGFAAGLSLIVAIGAQNAFVLRQGIARTHHWSVAALCAASDLALIAAGAAGLGSLIVAHPSVADAARWGGAAFLAAYAVVALRRALHPATLRAAPARSMTRRAALLTAAGFTFLNPHVYLDTVVLLGTIGATHGSPGRWWFAAGAGAGSVAWFSLLAAGGPRLAPLFARPGAWRVLDLVIAAVMALIALQLALG